MLPSSIHRPSAGETSTRTAGAGSFTQMSARPATPRRGSSRRAIAAARLPAGPPSATRSSRLRAARGRAGQRETAAKGTPESTRSSAPLTAPSSQKSARSRLAFPRARPKAHAAAQRTRPFESSSRAPNSSTAREEPRSTRSARPPAAATRAEGLLCPAAAISSSSKSLPAWASAIAATSAAEASSDRSRAVTHAGSSSASLTRWGMAAWGENASRPPAISRRNRRAQPRRAASCPSRWLAALSLTSSTLAASVRSAPGSPSLGACRILYPPARFSVRCLPPSRPAPPGRHRYLSGNCFSSTDELASLQAPPTISR